MTGDLPQRTQICRDPAPGPLMPCLPFTTAWLRALPRCLRMDKASESSTGCPRGLPSSPFPRCSHFFSVLTCVSVGSSLVLFDLLGLDPWPFVVSPRISCSAESFNLCCPPRREVTQVCT